MLAWIVSGIWVVQTTLDAVPIVAYDPSPWINVPFGMVMTYLFGTGIVAKWKNQNNNNEVKK